MDILSLTRNASIGTDNLSRTPQKVSPNAVPKPAADPPDGVPPDSPDKTIFAKKEANRIGQKTPETLLDRLGEVSQTTGVEENSAEPVDESIKLVLMGVQLPPRPAELVKAMSDLGISLPKLEGNFATIQNQLLQAVGNSNLPQPVKDLISEAIQFVTHMPAPASNLIDAGRVPMPTPGPRPMPKQDAPSPFADPIPLPNINPNPNPNPISGASDLPVKEAVQSGSQVEELDAEMMKFLNVAQTNAPNDLDTSSFIKDLPDPTFMPGYLDNLDVTVTQGADGEIGVVADSANPVKTPTPDPLGKPQVEPREVPNPTVEPTPSGKSAPNPGSTGTIGLTTNDHQTNTINVTKEIKDAQDGNMGTSVKGQDLVVAKGDNIPKPKPLGKPSKTNDVPGQSSEGTLDLISAKDQIKKNGNVGDNPKDLGRPTPSTIVKSKIASGSGDLFSAVNNKLDNEDVLPAPAPDTGPGSSPAPISGKPIQAAPPVEVAPKTLPKETTSKVINQVADRIENMVYARKSGTVTMKLNPQDLGTITLTVKSIGTKVDTEIKASQDEVRVALEANRQTLVQNVESRGLTLNSFNVSQGQGQSNTSQNHQMAQAEADRNAVLRQAISQPAAQRGTPRAYVNSNAAVDYFI